MEDQNSQKLSASNLATVKLTDLQVRQALVDYLNKVSEFKELIEGKKIAIQMNWQTNKWSDADHFVHASVFELTPVASDEAEQDEPAEAAEAAEAPSE